MVVTPVISTDLALALARAVVGLVIAAHGAQKVLGVWGGPGLAGWTQGVARMGMLCEWVLAESNGEALSVVFLDILQCGPEHETRNACEITELFEFDRSVCGTTDVRRFGSRLAQRELRWRRR